MPLAQSSNPTKRRMPPAGGSKRHSEEIAGQRHLWDSVTRRTTSPVRRALQALTTRDI